ncbi:MAG: hypothetical protein KatS3mg069_0008 [Meiothermus sp.]|nr:MAG: hypothetical protein KatS3mg069_0008 [Meiothermus sp.]
MKGQVSHPTWPPLRSRGGKGRSGVGCFLHDRTGKTPKAQVYETRRVLKAKPHTAYFVTRPLVPDGSIFVKSALIDAVLPVIHLHSQGKQELVGTFANGDGLEKEIGLGEGFKVKKALLLFLGQQQ